MAKWEYVPSGIGCSVVYDSGYVYYEPVQSVREQTPLEMVREFATVMGQPLDQSWDVVGPLESLRFVFIEEEFFEFQEEVDDPAKALKELADLVYVCYGYAATFGWDLDEAVKRVHQSNTSKLGDDGKPLYREDGKVLKSKNYKEPDLRDLV